MRSRRQLNDDTENIEDIQQSRLQKISYYLKQIRSKPFLIILLFISLVFSLRSILEHLQVPLTHPCVISKDPPCIKEQEYAMIEDLDEYGCIRNEVNLFPSKYVHQSIAAREKDWDEIAKTPKPTIFDPTNHHLLIIVSASVDDFQRRQIIRAHQINRYKNYTDIKWKFFIADPPYLYKDAIKFENDTYGDIIVLEHLDDSRYIARSIKTFEIFSYVEKYMDFYNYVAKMDTDEFVNIPLLYRKFLNETVLDLDFAIVSLFLPYGRFFWPQGGFEAVSWKLMVFLNRMYETVRRTTIYEDMQIEWYLYDAEVNYTKVAIHDSSYGEYGRLVRSPITSETILMHELKEEEDYLTIAKCFGPNGVDINMTKNLGVQLL